jgi:hypothetical protein
MARQNGPVPGPARSVLCRLRAARPGGRAGHGPLPRPTSRSRPSPLARTARERPGLLTPLYQNFGHQCLPCQVFIIIFDLVKLIWDLF